MNKTQREEVERKAKVKMKVKRKLNLNLNLNLKNLNLLKSLSVPNEELISSYIDRSAIKKETEETITDLNSLLEAFNKLKSTLSSVGSATNMQAAAAAVKDYTTITETAVKQVNNLTDATQKEDAAQKKKSQTTIENESAYQKLNLQYKEAVKNAQDLAAQYGVFSKEAVNAAQKAAILKKNLDDIAQLIKNVGTAPVSVNEAISSYDKLNAQLREANKQLLDLTTKKGQGLEVDQTEIDTLKNKVTALNLQLIKSKELSQTLTPAVAPTTTYKEPSEEEISFYNDKLLKDMNDRLQAQRSSYYKEITPTSVNTPNEGSQSTQNTNNLTAANDKLAASVEKVTKAKEESAAVPAEPLSPIEESIKRYILLTEQLKEVQAAQKELRSANPTLASSEDTSNPLYTIKANTKDQIEGLNIAMREQGNTFEFVKENADKLSEAVQNAAIGFSKLNPASQKQRLEGLNATFNDVSEAIKSLNQGLENPSEADYYARMVELEGKLRDIKIKISDVNKEVNNYYKTANTPEGSISEARAQNAQYTQARNNISAKPGIATADDLAEIERLNKLIDDNNKLIAENTSLLEKQKINIGNYKSALDGIGISDSGARFVNLTGALTTLQKGLTDAKVKMQELSAAGLQESQEGQFTAKEIRLLTVLVDQQEKGFSSLTRELYNTERALGTLQAAGLSDTEVFETLSGQIAKAHQNLNIFNEGQKNMAKTFPGIHVLANSIQELSSAYSVATSATALLSDSDEELQKKMGKFNALLTLGISLQQFATSVEKESATVRLVQVARINLMNAAKSVENVLFGRAAQAKTAEAAAAAADAAAQEELASATAAGTTAQAESVVATEGATVAMEGEAVAATEAAVATKTFATGFIATGIGAAIVAVGVALAFLVSKVNEYVSKGIAALKLSSDLADATKALNETLLEEARLFSDNADTQKKALEGFLEMEQKRGANSISQFAARKNIYAEETNLIQQQTEALQQLGIATDGTAQAQRKTQLESLNAQKEIYQKNIQTATTNKDDSGIAANQKLSDDAQKQIDAIKPIYDAVNALNTKQVENKKATDGLQIEEEKFTVDQQRAITLEGANQKAAIIKATNDSILSNDRSSLTQRLNAIRSSANAEKSVLETQRGELNKQQTAGTIDGAEYLNGINAINEKEKELTITADDAIAKEKETYRLKELAAAKTIADSRIQLDADEQKKLSDNDKLGLEERLNAYRKYILDEKALIDTDYLNQLQAAGLTPAQINKFNEDRNFKVTNAKLTNEELRAIQAQHNKASEELVLDSQKNIYDITKSWAKKIQEAAKTDTSQNNIHSESDIYAQDLQDLKQSLGKKLITVSQYESQKITLEQRYQDAKSREDIKNDKETLSRLEDLQQQELEAIGDANIQLTAAALSGGVKDVSDAKAKRDALVEAEKATNAEILKAREKLGADSAKLTDAEIARAIAAQKKKEALEKQIASELLTFTQTVVDAGFTREQTGLENQIALTDKKSQKEIEAVNQSVDSQVNKDKRIAEINARAAAQDEALKQRENASKMKQAQADKAFTIAGIVQRTAMAIMEIASTGGGAHYLDFGASAFTLEALTGALGAAQVATVLAQPLPKYFAGTENHAGGLAIVGDGGKKELVIEPTGRIWETPDKPTVVNLPKHTIVKPEVPDPKKMLALQMQFAKSKTDSILAQSHTLSQSYTVDSTAIINNNNKNARYIAKAIAENKPTIIQEGKNRDILMKYGASYHKHL